MCEASVKLDRYAPKAVVFAGPPSLGAEDIPDPLYGNAGGPAELVRLRTTVQQIRAACRGLLQHLLDLDKRCCAPASCAQTYLHFITGLLCLCANIACSPLSLDIPTANVGMTSFDKGIKTGVLLIFDGHERTSLQNCGSLPCTCILPFCSAPGEAHFLWSSLRVFIKDPLGRALFLN